LNKRYERCSFFAASDLIFDVAIREYNQEHVAFPILIVGSSILGVVDELGMLAVFEDMLRPVFVGFLGLPAYAATAFIFGILRKEMALEILAVLAGTAMFIDVMTPLQIYVFALVATIYVPCAATIAVIGKELGWRNIVLISGFTTYTVYCGRWCCQLPGACAAVRQK